MNSIVVAIERTVSSIVETVIGKIPGISMSGTGNNADIVTRNAQSVISNLVDSPADWGYN
jgi:S-ribosylhomocysteine lyase LuxS involved in autoinducer biosynthesis